MTKISQRLASADPQATVVLAKPERNLNEVELDRVTAATGMAGGVIGNKA